MLKTLWNDESGVILSAEIVLIGTILVLGMIVGLVELQVAVVGELADLSNAFGNLSQSYNTSGFSALGLGVHAKARTYGAANVDVTDACDCSSPTLMCGDTGEK